MAELYTPFLAQAGQTVGNALLARGQNQRDDEARQLFGQAYMGDPQAQQILAQVRPDLAMQVERATAQRQQRDLANRAQQQQQQLELAELAKTTSREALKFDNFEEANAFVEQEKERYRPVYGDALDQYTPFTEGTFSETKAALAEEVSTLDQARIDKINAEIEAMKNDSGDTKELLQVQKLLMEIQEKKKDAQATEEKEDMQVTEAVDAIADIDSLLDSKLDLIYGSEEAFQVDILRSQKGKDMIAKRDRIASLLQLAAAGKLKGQGQVSEGERAILRNAASTLDNETISPAAALEELQRARKTFEGTLKARGINASARQSGSPDAVQSLVDKYAD